MHAWWAYFLCFYQLIFSGFRHTALRELRFYLEASARSYFIDLKYPDSAYNEKVESLHKARFLLFRKLLQNLPTEKQREFVVFYHGLCDYVHLSEKAQTDALRDFGLNLSLRHPEYEGDKGMLEKTFYYSRHLLLDSLRKGKNVPATRTKNLR